MPSLDSALTLIPPPWYLQHLGHEPAEHLPPWNCVLRNPTESTITRGSGPDPYHAIALATSRIPLAQPDPTVTIYSRGSICDTETKSVFEDLRFKLIPRSPATSIKRRSL